MHSTILNKSFCHLHNLFGNFDLLILKIVVTLLDMYSQGFGAKSDKQPPIQGLVRVFGVLHGSLWPLKWLYLRVYYITSQSPSC